MAIQLYSITQYLFIILLILIDFYSKPLIFFTAAIQFLFISFLYVNTAWLKFLYLLLKFLGLKVLIMLIIMNYYFKFHIYFLFFYDCIICITLVLSLPTFLLFHYTKVIDIELHIESLRLIFKISLKTIIFFSIFCENDSLKNILFFVWLLTFIINLQTIQIYETSKTIKNSKRRIKVNSITETELEKLHNYIKSTKQPIEHLSFASQDR